MNKTNSFLAVLGALALGTGVTFGHRAPAAETEYGARSAEEAIAYEQAVTRGTETALQDFLEKYPTSPLASDVFVRLVALRGPVVDPSGTSADFFGDSRDEPCDPVAADCPTADEFFARNQPLVDTVDDFLSAQTTIY